MDAPVVARSRPRVAFVVQRCGEDVTGGAERLCLQHAEHMSDRWDCEILTTCARDARTWRNEFPAGKTTIAGVAARRFPVAAERDGIAFDERSRRVARGDSSLDDQEAWMRAQGPDAPELTTYVSKFGASYDRIFFYSYLYATTYFSLPHIANRAVLVPLAHDEWMFGLSMWERIFRSGAAIACVSEDERRLVERRFPGLHVDDRIVAPGVEAPQTDASAFRERYDIPGPYVVYVGRVELAKGIDDLVAYFLAARSVGATAKTLVIVGPIGMAVPESEALRVLGPVDERDKWNALAGADFAIVPSAYESLSLSAIEAWAVGKAILANGASAVLVGQCRRSNAGLWYANEREFVELLRSDLFGRADDLGRHGAAYVAERYTWSRTCDALGTFAPAGAW